MKRRELSWMPHMFVLCATLISTVVLQAQPAIETAPFQIGIEKTEYLPSTPASTTNGHTTKNVVAQVHRDNVFKWWKRKNQRYSTTWEDARLCCEGKGRLTLVPLPANLKNEVKSWMFTQNEEHNHYKVTCLRKVLSLSCCSIKTVSSAETLKTDIYVTFCKFGYTSESLPVPLAYTMHEGNQYTALAKMLYNPMLVTLNIRPIAMVVVPVNGTDLALSSTDTHIFKLNCTSLDLFCDWQGSAASDSSSFHDIMPYHHSELDAILHVVKPELALYTTYSADKQWPLQIELLLRCNGKDVESRLYTKECDAVPFIGFRGVC